jgi:hypothetical protein
MHTAPQGTFSVSSAHAGVAALGRQAACTFVPGFFDE